MSSDCSKFEMDCWRRVHHQCSVLRNQQFNAVVIQELAMSMSDTIASHVNEMIKLDEMNIVYRLAKQSNQKKGK